MAAAVKPTTGAGHPRQEQVLAAAASCFARYGFRKTTMADIASAARISRPALYLLYDSKEAVFQATAARHFAALLAEISERIDPQGEPGEQLRLAFEIWTVRQFTVVQDAPDAVDLLHNSRQLAAEAWDDAVAAFEAVIAGILATVIAAERGESTSALHVARVLVNAVVGYKTSARSVDELREWIGDLLDLVLAGLQAQAGQPASEAAPHTDDPA